MFVRSFLRLLFPPILLPILLPSLSAASTKRLIRSLLRPRLAFILDSPRRRLDRGTRLLRHYFVASLARSPRSPPPLRLSKRAPVPLPSFLRSAHKLPSVRPTVRPPALPSVSRPLRLTFSHNLASSVAPFVRHPLARSLLPPSPMAAGFRSVAMQPNFLEGKLDSDDSQSFAPFSAQVSPTCLPTFFSDSQMSSHRQSSFRKMVTPRLTRKVHVVSRKTRARGKSFVSPDRRGRDAFSSREIAQRDMFYKYSLRDARLPTFTGTGKSLVPRLPESR